MDEQTLKYLKEKADKGQRLQSQIKQLTDFVVRTPTCSCAKVLIRMNGTCNWHCLDNIFGEEETYRIVVESLTESTNKKLEELKAEFERL
jgi:hypothetical protein